MSNSVKPDQTTPLGACQFMLYIPVNIFFQNDFFFLNSLDPDQAQHFIETGLRPNCLQKGINRQHMAPLVELV